MAYMDLLVACLLPIIAPPIGDPVSAYERVKQEEVRHIMDLYIEYMRQYYRLKEAQ